MSPDLKIATAFVAPLGAADDEAVVEAMNRNASFIRGRLSPALRQMKYMPEFRFRLDTSYDNMARIDRLLRSPEVARDLDRERRGRSIMARRGKQKGRPVSGWLVLDKPVGMGSTEAVSKVKWLFEAEKAGHAGTLDPLASGMLPIALGEATKTVPYVMDGTKVYRFTVAWGEERTTDDLEGPVSRSSDLRPREAEIRALLPRYTGVIIQVPPQFSAIKIDGERAYDLARDGETLRNPGTRGRDRPPRPGRDDRRRHARARGRVRQGHLCALAGARHGARPRLLRPYRRLRRIEVDPFTADELVRLEALEAAASPRRRPGAEAKRRQPGDRFAAIDAFWSTPAPRWNACRRWRCPTMRRTLRLGNPVILRGRDAPVEADEVCATARGQLVAIGAIEAGMFKPKRVFRRLSLA